MNRFVDVVVAGHSHSFLNNRVNGKLIIEAFSFGTAFDQVNMKVDRRTGEVIESSGEVVTTYNDEAAGVAPDPETAALVASYDDTDNHDREQGGRQRRHDHHAHR